MKKGDLLLILLFLLLGAASWLYIWNLQSDRVTALIIQDGTILHELELATLTEPLELRIEDGRGGYNLVRAERGRICVLEANCPEQVDVLQGWISKPHESLVCLPHRLVIKIQGKEKSDIDGIVR